MCSLPVLLTKVKIERHDAPFMMTVSGLTFCLPIPVCAVIICWLSVVIFFIVCLQMSLCFVVHLTADYNSEVD